MHRVAYLFIRTELLPSHCFFEKSGNCQAGWFNVSKQREECWNNQSGWIKCIQTCLKKLETVRVTGRNVSKLEPRSSGDQLLLLSEFVRRSREPRRVREPISLALFFNWSKLLLLDLRSATGRIMQVQEVLHYTEQNTWGVQVLRSPNLLFILKELLTTGSWKCSHFSM